jgi:hypothetical protein
VLMKHRTLNDEALSYYHKHTAEIEIIRHDRSIEPSIDFFVLFLGNFCV